MARSARTVTEMALPTAPPVPAGGRAELERVRSIVDAYLAFSEGADATKRGHLARAALVSIGVALRSADEDAGMQA